MTASDYIRVKRAARAVLKAEWSSSAYVRDHVIAAGRAYADRLTRLRALRSAPRRARAASFHHFRALSTRVCGVLLTAAHKKRHLTWAQVLNRANAINLRRPCGEPVRVSLKLKKKQKPGAAKKYRPITSFGMIRATCQYIFRDWLRARLAAPQSEYARAGRGRDAAVKDLVKELNANGGKREVLTWDVVDFFPSITSETLAPLIPAPASVRGSCLFVEKGAKIETDTQSLGTSLIGEDQSDDVPPVLSQGSLASPDVASHVMHDLMKALPSKSRGRSFMDDGVVAVADAAEAQTTMHALTSRASAQHGGPLSLTFRHGRPLQYAGPPVDYLGYRLKRSSKSAIRATPRPELITTLIARLTARLKTVTPSQVTEVAFKTTNHWRKSQSAWDFAPGSDHFWVQVEIAIQQANTHHQNKARPKKVKSPNPILEMMKAAKPAALA